MTTPKLNTRRAAVLAACLMAAGAAAAIWSTQARSQVNAAPSWVPIGVAGSGSGSAAWFHEPSSRQVAVCQAQGQAVSCAIGKLP